MPLSCPLPVPGQSWDSGKKLYKGKHPAPKDTHGENNWGRVSLGDRFLSKLHEQTDSCGCCVELGHLVFLHNAPQAAHIWVCGDPLKLTPMKARHFWSFSIVPPFPYHYLSLYILPFLTMFLFSDQTSQELLLVRIHSPCKTSLSPGNRT